MRRFRLLRHAQGAEAASVVGEGIQFSDGIGAIRWFGHSTEVVDEDKLDVIERLYGGRIEVIWLEARAPVPREAALYLVPGGGND